jgi:hypothetical protein
MGEKTREYTEVTTKIYKTSNRPYIGISGISSDNSDGKHLKINCQIKNFGTVPATKLRISDNIILDGKSLVQGDVGAFDNHSNLFPQGEMSFSFYINNESGYTGITSGNNVLDIEVVIKYTDIINTGNVMYEDRETWRYDRVHNNIYPISGSAK